MDNLTWRATWCAQPVLDFFANLENLQAAGYMSEDEVLFNWGMSIRVWTAICWPLIELANQRADLAGSYLEMPVFADKMRARAERRGNAPYVIDPASIPALLDHAIDTNTARLRQKVAAQSGVIPARPDAAAASA